MAISHMPSMQATPARAAGATHSPTPPGPPHNHTTHRLGGVGPQPLPPLLQRGADRVLAQIWKVRGATLKGVTGVCGWVRFPEVYQALIP